VSILQQMKQQELNFEMPPNGEVPSSEMIAAMVFRESPTHVNQLMEKILERKNMKRALKRVIRNDGAPGVDRMTVHELKGYLKRHWPKIKQALLDGTYIPLPVRRKEIPKPDGSGVRLLGIPAALDRLSQQAVAQILNDIWDSTFSESSHGFRQKRSCHDAIRQCQGFLGEEYRYVVDLDLAKFLDPSS
jgi:RNA-directed DNA polymerase